jgi:hypothetical protein
MAVSPIGSSPLGTIVPPGVKPNAAEVLRLRAQLDLVHAQLMSGVRPSPQRMVVLLNAYLDAVRQLHGNVAALNMAVVHKKAGHGSVAPVDVCIVPAPPAPPIPIPYPNVPASSATKTPATKQAQRSKIESTHHQIKFSSDTPAAQMGGIASKHIMGVCQFVLYSFDVKFEGKSAVPGTMFTNNNNRP